MDLGIIAEAESDVEVMRAFTLSLLRPRRIRIRPFIAGGCGKLRRKCGAWAINLVRRGCSWIVVVHDLDRNDENELKSKLAAQISAIRASASLVLLPKYEMEAWLLYDAKAIAAAFKERKQLRLPGDPEGILDPKEYLKALVRRSYGKTYLSTVHNELIAQNIDIRLLRRSRSFSPHIPFTDIIRRGLH